MLYMAIAMPIGCFAGGKVVRRIVNAIGIKTPPVNPWQARKTIIEGRFQAKAQQTEKNINAVVLAIKYNRIENTLDNHPVKGITTISATK